jgi:RimJ/RimL family protein N-acetyltransferase
VRVIGDDDHVRYDGARLVNSSTIPTITFAEVDPAADVEALVDFLAANSFPYHRVARTTREQAREVVVGGRLWSADSVGFWVEADGTHIGIAVIDDLTDVADGGNPVFDLRLAEAQRGRGLGVPVLRALTDLVFTRWPDVSRVEGHTREDNAAMRATFRRAGWVKEAFHRDAWPVDGATPKASVAYAVLRRDWISGTTTPVPWDDL